MTQDNETKSKIKHPSQEHNKEQSGSRRRLITGLATGGVVTSSLLISGKWRKPLVESVILPAHAQTSQQAARNFVATGTFARNLAKNIGQQLLQQLIPDAVAGTSTFDSSTFCASETGPGTGLFNILAEFHNSGFGAGLVEKYSATGIPADNNSNTLTQATVCIRNQPATIKMSGLTATQLTVAITAGVYNLNVTAVLGTCGLPSGAICAA